MLKLNRQPNGLGNGLRVRFQANLFTIMLCFSALATGAFASALPAEARDLKVTTMNIKWYGLGGSLNNEPQDEYRDRQIKKFIQQALDDSDVIMFQEIVDVDRFKREIIGGSRYCVNYYHSDRKHQRVVFCYKKQYRFYRVTGDNNYALESVTLGRGKSRPALHGILADNKGNAIAYILGVHLKAYPSETDQRLRQVELMADQITGMRSSLPVIALGDYNTHIRKNTGYRKDDKYLMDDIFRWNRSNLKLVRTDLNTYRNGDSAQQLDQIWVSRFVKINGSAEVEGPCDYYWRAKPAGVDSQYQSIDYYNDYVSDHCPLTVSLDLDPKDQVQRKQSAGDLPAQEFK